MAGSSTRGRIARILTTVGIIWIIWSFISGSGLIDLDFGGRFVDLPLLPGIALIFLGRVLGRNARSDDAEEVGPETAPGPTVPTRMTPTPRSERRRVIESAPEPEAQILSQAISGMDEEIVDAVDPAGPRKTSAEMVADARRKFGSRP